MKPHHQDPSKPRLPAGATRKGLSPKQQDFIEWLCRPKGMQQPTFQGEWAKEHNVNINTLSAWKRDPAFRAEWDHRLYELRVNPESVSEVLASMHMRAVQGGDVQAAKLWLEVAGRYKQTTVVEVDDKRAIKELSDAELDALVADEVVDELAARRLADE